MEKPRIRDDSQVSILGHWLGGGGIYGRGGRLGEE